jgi:hypothetical protein
MPHNLLNVLVQIENKMGLKSIFVSVSDSAGIAIILLTINV